MSPGETHDIFEGTEQIQQLVISRPYAGIINDDEDLSLRVEEVLSRLAR